MAGTANCVRALARVAGRDLSDDEIRAIFERVHRAALDIKAGRAQPSEVTAGRKIEAIGTGQAGETLVQQAASRAAAELLAEARTAERNAHLQLAKLGARQSDVQSIRGSGIAPLDAVEKTIVRDFSGRVNVESLEQKVSGWTSYFGRKLIDTWTSLGDDWLGFFQDRAKLLNLVKELRGEDSGDALAKRGAKVYHEVAEEARQVFNQNGGSVGKLDDWGMPQHHSQERVAAAGRDVWVNTILPMLDRARYVDDLGMQWGDAELRKFLEKAWDTIATNGHANVEPGKHRGSGSVANRHAESRQIHFKDAESVIDYWNAFGDRTAVEILTGHVDRMSRDIAFVEHFGPNPNTTFQALRDAALRDATMAEPTKTQQLEGRAVGLDNLYEYVSGRTKPTYRQWLKATADGIAHLNSAGKLGGAMLASLFGDKPMMEAVSHLNDMPMMQRWATELRLLNPAAANDRRLLQTQGLMLDSIRSGLQRFYEGLGESSTTGKLANAVMRVTGMQAINDIRKGAFGLSLMAAIGEELRKGVDFSGLADSDVRALRNYGITEADWKVWQLAQRDTLAGVDHVLTPEGISRIADADILAAAPSRVQATRDAFNAQILDLQGRIASDAQRVAERRNAFADLQDRVNRAVKDFAANRQKAAAERIAGLEERIDAVLGDMADVRESTAEGTAAVRARMDAAVADAKQVGALRERMKQMARDVTEAITTKAEDARDRIEAYREQLVEFMRSHPEGKHDEAAAKRQDKFHAIQDRINRTVREFAEGKQEGLADSIADVQGRVDDLLGDVAAGRQAVVEALRASTAAVDAAGRGGREYGQLRERARVALRDAQRAIEGKASDAGDRIEAARAAIAEFEAGITERADRRQAVIDRLTRERDEALSGLPEQLRRDAIVRLLSAVNTESEFAIVTPGWRERAQFYAGKQRGTVWGEISRSVLQFKAFPWAMLQRGMDAVANMDGPASKSVMAAYLMMSTTAAGAMLIQTRDLLSGKDPREMGGKDWYKFWGQAFMQGGALGIYGDFLYGINQTRYGSGPLETLSGPTIGPLLELALVQPLNAAKAKVEGKDTHLAAQTIQDLKGFVPGGNIWYLKAALDHLVWQRVMEALSPGYLANMRTRTMRDFNQDWWWRPGETTPERAPEMAKALGR